MGIRRRSYSTRISHGLLILLVLLFSSTLQAETFQLGLHYDIARDGHGIDLHKVGNTYVMFLYTYDDNGDPEWYLGVGDWNDGVITGSLDRFNYIVGNTPPQTADPSINGTFTLDHRFAAVQGACNDGVDRANATQMSAFAFKIRDEEYIWCTQFLFGGKSANTTYVGGAWFSLGDEGYGYSMSQEDEAAVAIVYYYDDNNEPRWALAPGSPLGEMVLENYTGYCRDCPLMERIKDPAGTITFDWDESSIPGSGSDAADLDVTYPNPPFGTFDKNMVLTPITDLAPTDDVQIGDMPSQDFYNMFIGQQVIETTCIACHVSGGVAAGTSLVYTAGDDQGNFTQIANLVGIQGSDYILNKARGVAHGGGTQLSSESNEYKDLELLFGVMDGSITEPQAETVPLFTNVSLQSYEQTLRRASLLLAGRLPTDAELAVAAAGDEAQIKETLRDLMQGDAFHQFLLESANDRLLTDKYLDEQVFNAAFEPYYPEYNLMYVQTINKLNQQQGDDAARYITYQETIGSLRRATAREPLELMAYVIENDLPYTEVVTANYTMVNPLLAQAYKVEGVTFQDPDDHDEFQPGVNKGQIMIDRTYQANQTENYNQYLTGGIPHTMRHAGVLNTLAFLARYPSTATNRNRARARWAYYYFLGVDIEKAAERTTDPDALADTDNPTMNNPACTVCHQLHDPVAGTFQNYGDDGFYRSRFGGMDALPGSYVNGAGSGYQQGDTWFSDMRVPGFNGEEAPSSDNSLQWFAGKIAEDPRFGPAAVKFWWPALFGRVPLEVPEEAADENFEAQLLAFEEQNTFIEDLGTAFAGGFDGNPAFNLKDLLVEIILSPWFRADGLTGPISDEQTLALEAGFVGAEKLLTPEQLERKTLHITGYVWNLFEDILEDFTGFGDQYRVFYGGIDSDGINQRTVEISSVMSSVVAAFAAETACPIVALDFDAPEGQRKLFNGLTRFDTPANAEQKLRDHLVGWHDTFFGDTVDANSPQVNRAYDLLESTWALQSADPAGNYLEQACNFNGFQLSNEDFQRLANDPDKMIGSWRLLLTYFLTDYRFIFE